MLLILALSLYSTDPICNLVNINFFLYDRLSLLVLEGGLFVLLFVLVFFSRGFVFVVVCLLSF